MSSDEHSLACLVYMSKEVTRRVLLAHGRTECVIATAQVSKGEGESESEVKSSTVLSRT